MILVRFGLRMASASLVVLLASVFFTVSTDAGEIIFYEDFKDAEDGASLGDLGWKVTAKESQSLWAVEDGYLKATFFHNPYQGGFVEKEIPLIRRGTLDFDANIAIEGRGEARGLGLTVEIYNITTWFHDYLSEWQRYFPEPPSMRKPGFRIEPVGHEPVTAVRKGEWHHFRIYFDADEGIVEYYLNDMSDPVRVDSDVPVLGRAEYAGRYLRFANIGFVNGPVSYAIDNIKLRRAPDNEAAVLQEDENHILIFQGISSNEYLVKEALDGMDDYGIREYWVQQPGPALVPKNRFSMNRLPGRITLDNSRVIILADVPVSPDNVVPAYFLRRLEDWVKAGGVLITLGGPFSYAKGGYKNTLLEDVLPFYIAESPWDCIEKADKPRIMVLGKDFGVLAERTRREHPAVYYSHNVELKEGSKTLINCDQDIPLWVYRDYGEGRVISFTGTPMGVSGGGSVLFTEWEGWGDLLREIVKLAVTE